MIEENSIHRSRNISIALFVLGLLMLAGADSFKDFYYEMKFKSSGDYIDYSTLSDFCGWTGGPLPGESDLQYGIRAFWNMLSAMLAMSLISLFAFGIVAGVIMIVAYLMGGFK